jgi:hypothetical protein
VNTAKPSRSPVRARLRVEGVRDRFTGRAAIREALAQRFAAIPDIRCSDGRHWIFGNKALSEWRVQGTLPDGGRLDCLSCDLWEFRGGKVVKKAT